VYILHCFFKFYCILSTIRLYGRKCANKISASEEALESTHEIYENISGQIPAFGRISYVIKCVE